MILDDIEKAKNKINSEDFQRYTLEDYFLKIYFMSSENLSGYLSKFDYKGKSVLTTGSSCDQVLNLISYGIRDIDHFDINPFVKYYYELKKAGILELDNRSYLDFFNNFKKNDSKKVLDEKVYYRLSKNLGHDAKLFWDTLYNLYKPSVIKRKLFFVDNLPHEKAIRNNDYLKEDNYLAIRKIIENIKINFINKNISDLSLEDKKYDYILLSNIFEYLFNLDVIVDDYELDEKLCDYTNYVNNFSKYLNDNGTMFFHYFWDSDINALLHRIFRLFYNNERVSSISFPNYKFSDDYLDTVMVYRKTLKK